MPEQRRGVAYGIAAYGLWGLMPLYFPLLRPAGAVEILAHRMAWSLVFVLAILGIRRQWSWLTDVVRTPRRLALLALAALAIAVNWGTYVWGVNHGHVVEVSLGYFINPLLTVVLGVIVLRERLRPLQWTAVGVATVAVAVLTVDYGHPPWIALILAGCFAAYGFIKKRVDMETTESLAVETGFQFVPAVLFLVFLEAQGRGTFGHATGDSLWLVSAGIVTAVPLLFFGAAAVRIPLSMIGMLQYLTPTIQFLIGVLVYREAMPPGRLAGFSLVWLALTLLTLDGLGFRRRARAGRSDRVTPAEATR